MATLGSLPPEIIDETLSYLPQSRLLAVCRSCKALQRYAEPLIYKSVAFRFTTVYSRTFRKGPRAASPIHSFFRTIWHRPALADHVQVARFTVEEHSLIDVPNAVPPPELLPALRAGCTKAGLSPLIEAKANSRRDPVTRGNANCLTAVLVSMLHRLAALELDYSLLQESHYLTQVLRPSWMDPDTRRKTPHFPGLKRLSVLNDIDHRILRMVGDGHETKADAMLELLCHPTLEEAELVLESEPGSDFPWDRYGNDVDSGGFSLPGLRRLGLLHCSFAGPATLGRMLAIAPRLEMLEFFFAQDLACLEWDQDHRLECRDEWRAFAAALRHVQGTLKHLVISVDFGTVDDHPLDDRDMDWVFGIWQRRRDLGSLQHLPALERLEVPIFLLLGWLPAQADRGLADVLPRNLKELCLRDDLIDCGDYPWTPFHYGLSFQETCDASPVLRVIADYLAPLGVQGDGERPLSLEKICLKVHKDRVWPFRSLTRLREMSQAAGITCTVRERMSKTGDFQPGVRNWTDEVREIVIFDPAASDSEEEPSGGDASGPEDERWNSEPDPEHPGRHLRCSSRYFNEPSRQFRENL